MWIEGYLKNRNGCGAFCNRVRGVATHPTLANVPPVMKFLR